MHRFEWRVRKADLHEQRQVVVFFGKKSDYHNKRSISLTGLDLEPIKAPNCTRRRTAVLAVSNR
jgi:hypothetical protein